MRVEIELERLRGVYKRSRLRENILENAYRLLVKRRGNGSRGEKRLGCNSAIFPGKGEPNFNKLNCKSSVLDWHGVW